MSDTLTAGAIEAMFKKTEIAAAPVLQILSCQSIAGRVPRYRCAIRWQADNLTLFV